MTIMELNGLYSTEEKCREYLKRLRWPNGVTCPRCQHTAISRLKTHGKFECAKCEYQFSVTAGTIFHDSHLSLEQWFFASYLMCESRKGISANQLKRVLGISYKTAWYLCHRIRAAMKDADTTPLKGTVEVDETYIGGKRRGRWLGTALDNKTMVLGAIQRGGEVRLKVEKRPTRRILHNFIKRHTTKDHKTVYTDDWSGYRWIKGDDNITHDSVNHSENEWVRGNVHTNTVEGVFSLFKRSIVGAYHHLSAKHLPAYLDEFEFRFNRRRRADLFADTIKHLVSAKTMTFKTLVSI